MSTEKGAGFPVLAFPNTNPGVPVGISRSCIGFGALAGLGNGLGFTGLSRTDRSITARTSVLPTTLLSCRSTSLSGVDEYELSVDFSERPADGCPSALPALDGGGKTARLLDPTNNSTITRCSVKCSRECGWRNLKIRTLYWDNDRKSNLPDTQAAVMKSSAVQSGRVGIMPGLCPSVILSVGFWKESICCWSGFSFVFYECFFWRDKLLSSPSSAHATILARQKNGVNF